MNREEVLVGGQIEPESNGVELSFGGIDIFLLLNILLIFFLLFFLFPDQF